MKKLLYISFLAGFISFTQAQKVFPYFNNQNYFKSFNGQQSVQLDFLLPKDYQYSENLIAYINSRNDLMVYNGIKQQKLTGFANGYQVGQNIVAWNTGSIINIYYKGDLNTLTKFGGRYAVSDSLVVFEDTQDNAVKVFYKGKIFTLYRSVSTLVFPDDIGSNTVAFVGNGNIAYAFIAGHLVEIGSVGRNVEFSAGANLVAFNDDFHQSFAVCFRDGVYNLESIQVQNYQAGYDKVVYLDQNDDLKAYTNGNIVQLTSNVKFYKIFRNVIVWGENNSFFVYWKGEKYQVANYVPKNYKIRNGIVAFRDINGGISAFYQGVVERISNLQDKSFEVNGNTIKIQVTPGNYVFYKNGHKYRI